MVERPLILVSNDDGVQAQGLRCLAHWLVSLADVIVVAPHEARSGAACSITTGKPVSVTRIEDTPGCRIYSCTGTPVDCVKLALDRLVPRSPALVVSGINHGDNASVSLHYSGTVGCVTEGCVRGIPSIAYSLMTRELKCDFTPYQKAVLHITSWVLQNGLAPGVFLNVNFPHVPLLQGIRVCRMARGRWESEWDDTSCEDTFRLGGHFVNLEPEADDTDYWALQHGIVSVTPLHIDVTDTPSLSQLQSLTLPIL